MKPNITELIVEHDLCIGYGMYPVDVLPMKFNSFGMYIPSEIPACLDK